MIRREVQIGDATALVREALEILTNLHDSIAKHGNYSAESTMAFVDQAASALRDSLSRKGIE